VILTAAHCQALIDRVYINVYDVINDPANATIYTVQSITVHPLYDKDLFRYDFNIIHLHQSVVGVSPVRLNSNLSIPSTENTLTVLGWGAIVAPTETTNAVYPNIFQKGYVRALTNENCGATVIDNLSLYQGEIYDEMLCAEGLVSTDQLYNETLILYHLQ
jgi:Trypsin